MEVALISAVKPLARTTMLRKRGLLDKILEHIPGYSGYADRESCRRDDSRVRDRVVQALRQSEAELEERLRTAFHSGDLAVTDELERCRKDINTLTGRVQFAPVGSSTIMSDQILAETELQKILACDQSLLDDAVRLEEKSKTLNARDLRSVVSRLSAAVSARNAILREVK
jgi:hypothetical protein